MRFNPITVAGRIIWAVAVLFALIGGGASTVLADQPKPKIAVFSGPTATIQNSPSLITSNKARELDGLPLLTEPDGTLRTDVLRMQRIAAPVTVYVEQFSAHPLEKDAAALYAPLTVTWTQRASFIPSARVPRTFRYTK